MGISVGMVGLGMFGPAFIEAYKSHPDVHRLALCDLRSDRLSKWAKQFEISETYSSLDEICKSDLDALVIITQHWMHAPQAIQAMESGKHVYTAVPAAASLDECEALVRTVERTGMIYMNGETSYFRPEAVFCRQKAAEGAFGEFVHCRAEYFHDMDHGLYNVAKNRMGSIVGSRQDWRYSDALSDAFNLFPDFRYEGTRHIGFSTRVCLSKRRLVSRGYHSQESVL